jgi:hypothetical protein
VPCRRADRCSNGVCSLLRLSAAVPGLPLELRRAAPRLRAMGGRGRRRSDSRYRRERRGRSRSRRRRRRTSPPSSARSVLVAPTERASSSPGREARGLSAELGALLPSLHGGSPPGGSLGLPPGDFTIVGGTTGKACVERPPATLRPARSLGSYSPPDGWQGAAPPSPLPPPPPPPPPRAGVVEGALPAHARSSPAGSAAGACPPSPGPPQVSPPPLPIGWESRRDFSGALYNQHRASGQKQWTYPDPAPPTVDLAAPGGPSQQHASQQHVELQAIKAELQVLQGAPVLWDEFASPAGGKMWIHRDTNVVSRGVPPEVAQNWAPELSGVTRARGNSGLDSRKTNPS